MKDKDKKDKKNITGDDGGWLSTSSIETTRMVEDPSRSMGDEIIDLDAVVGPDRKKIMVLILIALVLIGSIVWLGRRYFVPKRQGKPLAVLASVENQVDVRPAGEVGFKPAEDGISLYEEDAVKTGARSKAFVSFYEGGDLDIDENSLVIIKALDRNKDGILTAMDVDLNFGHVYSAPTVTMRFRGGKKKDVEVKAGSKVVVDKNKKGEIYVSVLSGTAKVGGKTVVAGKGVSVKGKSINIVELPNVPRVIAPRDGLIIEVPKGKVAKVYFDLEHVAGAYYDIRIGRLNDKKYFIHKKQQHHRFSFPFAERGGYWWDAALVIGNLAGPRTKRMSFEIVDETLEEEAPKEEKKIFVPSEKLSVAAIIGDMRYRSKRGKLRVASVGTILKEGYYFITAVDGETELSFRNAPLLRVGPYTSASFNLLRTGRRGHLKVGIDLKHGEVLLHAAPFATGHVDFSVSVADKRIDIKTIEIEGRSSDILVASYGDGFSVECFRGKGVVRIDGEPYEVKANTGIYPQEDGRIIPLTVSPVNVVSAEGETPVIFFKSVPDRITLAWEKNIEGRIMVARDENFDDSILNEPVKGTFFTLYGLSSGVYWWKVFPSNTENNVHTSKFIVARMPDKLKREKFVVSNSRHLTKISYYALPPVIKFSWKPKRGADGYEIEIFSDHRLSKRIYKKVFKGHKVSFLADFLKKGTFYWRVNILSGTSTKIGSVRKLVLDLDPESPAIKLTRPSDNALVDRNRYRTRGRALRKVRLEINKTLVGHNILGPFSRILKLNDWKNDIVYKVIDEGGGISYYRRIIFKY